MIGRPLAQQLREAGHEALALGRSTDLRTADLAGVLRSFRPEVVMHQATDLPRSLSDPLGAVRGIARTERLRRDGTPRLVDAAVATGARRVVAQSIAFRYRPGPGPARTESDPLDPGAPGSGGVEALERSVLGSPLEAVVLRYGAFYGPGTFYARDGAFVGLIRRRLLPLVRGGDGQFPFVHVDDAARATVAALEGPTGVFNVVDDEPAPASEWVPTVAELVGAGPPRTVPRALLGAGPLRELRYLLADQPAISNRRART